MSEFDYKDGIEGREKGYRLSDKAAADYDQGYRTRLSNEQLADAIHDRHKNGPRVPIYEPSVSSPRPTFRKVLADIALHPILIAVYSAVIIAVLASLKIVTNSSCGPIFFMLAFIFAIVRQIRESSGLWHIRGARCAIAAMDFLSIIGTVAQATGYLLAIGAVVWIISKM